MYNNLLPWDGLLYNIMNCVEIYLRIFHLNKPCNPQINLSLQKEAQLHKSARPMGLSTKQQESFGPCHAPLSRHGPPELYV